MPAERTPTKASELRRSTKPIMEKRRRARINNSLAELKNLILDALKKDNARHSKLEKADILEMTVKHLQQLQRQQRLQQNNIPDQETIGKFRAGFGECAAEVSRYLNREQADDALRSRLLGHLSNCLTSLAPTPSFYGQPPSPVSSPNPHQTAMPTTNTNVEMKPVHVQVPVNELHQHRNGGLQFVATRLPSGEIAFLLPPKRETSTIRQSNTTSVITHSKQRCPVNVLGSSGILSPAASDRSSPSPSSPLSLTVPYHVQQVFEPISPVPVSAESVWRPW